MATRRVEITLGPDGSIKVEGFGSCNKVPELDLLRELYGDPENMNLKEEHFEVADKSAFDGLPSGYCG